jgi:integrase
LADLSRKRTRERLAVRREPYWQRLAEGAYLGFRRGPDTWLARWRGRDTRQQYHALGEAIEYDEAKRRAEQWLAQLTGSAVRAVKRASVSDALATYLADLTRHGRADTAKDAAQRFVAYGLLPPKNAAAWTPDPLAAVELEAATQEDFLEWRDRQSRSRAARTVNRNVRAVVAALNRARKLGHVGNPESWKLTPLADDVEDESEAAVFLTAEQRRALVAAAAPAAAAFLRALELTGARPRELAAARVSDFDGETLRLAHRKGRPPRLRTRRVVLSEEGAAFFSAQTRDKLPAAPIFTEDGEQPWRRHTWSRAIRAGVAAHNAQATGKHRIPPGASAYSFRHARISELLQVHGVDPLTVAQQTGTSLSMIEKSYLRFIPQAMAAKLAAVKESA